MESPKIEALEAEIKTRAIRKLVSFYSQLMTNAEFEGSSVKMPIIDFRPMKGHWGEWNPRERAIYLNERLVMEAPWTAVKGIFSHEVAHFLVDEIFSHFLPTESLSSPHGKAFKMVCGFLEMDSFFTAAAVDLNQYEGPPPSPWGGKRKEAEEHPVLAKVKKLLALASSAETHESAAALSAAERLLTRHNLDMPEEVAGRDSPYERWLIPLGKVINFRHSAISCILRDYFFVNTIFTYEYMVKEDQVVRLLEIVGKPVNLAMAEYVYNFLEERCATLWQAYKPQASALGEKGASAKNAFMSNLLNAFANKLSKEKELASKNSSGEKVVKDTSLIVSLKEERDEFVKSCYPRLGTRKARSVGHASPSSARAGWKAGEKLTLHVPVGNKSSSGPQGRLPGGK